MTICVFKVCSPVYICVSTYIYLSGSLSWRGLGIDVLTCSKENDLFDQPLATSVTSYDREVQFVTKSYPSVAILVNLIQLPQ